MHIAVRIWVAVVEKLIQITRGEITYRPTISPFHQHGMMASDVDDNEIGYFTRVF
jgi:predicted SnoaL-like aldol condensation-catalyzing enzyme